MVIVSLLVLVGGCGDEAVAGYVCAGPSDQCVDPISPPVVASPSVWLAASRYDESITVVAYDSSLRALHSYDWRSNALVPTHRISANGPDLNRGQYPALATGPHGTLYAAYYDAVSTDIRRARLNGDNWIELDGVVDGGESNVGTWLSLDIDAGGGWHLAYRDETSAALRIASLDAEDAGCHGKDGPGSPLLVTAQDMADAGWPSGDFGTHTSLGVLKDGRLAVSYYDSWRTNLMLATCEGSSVQLQMLDGEDLESGYDYDAGRWNSLDIDPITGRLGIAYFDATQGALKFISSRNGMLLPTVIDDGGNADHHVGLAASLKFNVIPDYSEGLPQVAYVDSTAREIRLARQTVYGEWSQIAVKRLTGNPPTRHSFGPSLELVVSPQPSRVQPQERFEAQDTDRSYVIFSEWTDSLVSLHVATCDPSGCSENAGDQP